MSAKRINPSRVKLHRTYSVEEVARLYGIHKNTVRAWRGRGLEALDGGRPVLFQGSVLRAFLKGQRAGRKRPCPPGTMYCFRCREPRRPALDMVDYEPINMVSGNLRALCAACETVMHRRVRAEAIQRVMPGIMVQTTGPHPRLDGCPSPSLNCDMMTEA